VWLDPAKTSVYKFYQFWLNVDDEGAIDYMKIYTLLDKPTIEAIAADQAENPAARVAQRKLAAEITDLVHGRERREAVERVTNVLFGSARVDELSGDELDMLAAEIPIAPLGSTLVEALVASGVAESNSDARRLIDGHAVSVNGAKEENDPKIESTSLIKKGKNSFILVR
jgi:tyrosyl-tRNA synthetase